jgi:hypothetical protein
MLMRLPADAHWRGRSQTALKTPEAHASIDPHPRHADTQGGGHAFIGLYLAKELLYKGHDVTILNDGDEVRCRPAAPASSSSCAAPHQHSATTTPTTPAPTRPAMPAACRPS